MNLLWFSWKDTGHPLAGGAESVSNQIMRRLVRDGHNVRLITSRYKNSPAEEEIDGIKIYRTGGRFSVYLKAFLLYRKKFKNWHDAAIDEMNTIPFGVGLFTRKRPILITYQLARKIWFYQMPQPISTLGYLLEPIYLFSISRSYKVVATESESTKRDLARFGFKSDKISTFRVGISLMPIVNLTSKKNPNTVLILGALRPMKKTIDGIKAYEVARDTNPNLNLVIAGNDTDKYADKVKAYVAQSKHKSSIELRGPVSNAERLTLMRESAIILATSVKEGWGLTVTEANSQGTPAIAYDVDGLRDSIADKKTGVLVEAGNTIAMGIAINQLLGNLPDYESLRKNAWEHSKQFTFDNSYADFKSILFNNS